MNRSHDVSQLTSVELELTRRQLRANLALITPGSPAHVPILAHIQAIDAELAARAGNPQRAGTRGDDPGDGAGPLQDVPEIVHPRMERDGPTGSDHSN